MDAVTLAMHGNAMVIDRDAFMIDVVTFAMYRHTFESDRDPLAIDAVTLAMSAIAVVLPGNAGAWF